MEHKTEKIIIGAAILLAVAGAGWYVWYRSVGGELTSPVGPGEEIIRPIKNGVIVSSFPEEFIPKEEIFIKDSYAIRYTEEKLQPVLEYESSLSLEENIKTYYDILSSYNWNITHLASPFESPTFYYAVLGDMEINITFLLSSGRVIVTVSYLRRL